MTRRLSRMLVVAASVAATLAIATTPVHADSFLFFFSEPSFGPVCGENVSGVLEGVIVLAGTRTAKGDLQITAHVNARGVFVGDEHTFHVSAAGTDHFEALGETYTDLSFSGRVVSEGGGPNITFDAVLRWYSNGDPAEVVSWTFYC